MTSADTPKSLYEKKEDYFLVLDMPPGLWSRDGVQPPAAEDICAEWIDEKWLGHRAMVIHNAVSPSECQAMIDYCEGRVEGVEIPNALAELPNREGLMIPATVRTDYRNNLRVSSMAPDLADILFQRIAPFLQDESKGISEGNVKIDASNATLYEEGGIGILGRWQMTGVNPCFRICKYHPNGHFGPHYDAEYFKSYTARSLKTFMIYLNDDYTGGCTNFVENHDLNFNKATDRYEAPREAVRAQLKAKRGDILIFDHLLLHEGGTVHEGVKYIMRAEVMYERAPAETDEEKRLERGYLLLYEAKRLEAEKDFEGAIAKYRAAFKVAPELEANS